MVYDPAVPRKLDLGPDKRDEVSLRYWQTSIQNGEIERAFRIPRGELLQHVVAQSAEMDCANCGNPMRWHSRTGRETGDAICSTCRHHLRSDACACNPCKALREARLVAEATERARRRRRIEEDWQQAYGRGELVLRAVRLLTPPQRLFLDGVRRAIASGGYFSWKHVAVSVGLEPRHTALWVNRLVALNLIWDVEDDNESWVINDGLEGLDLLGPLPRLPASRRRA